MLLLQDSVKEFAKTLDSLLVMNNTNIWNKKHILSGIQAWDNKCGKNMKQIGKASVYDDQAVRLMALLQELATRKRNTTTGARLPNFMKQLIDRIDQDDDIPGSPSPMRSRDGLSDVSPQKSTETQLVKHETPDSKAISTPSTSASSGRKPLIRRLTKSDSESSARSIASTSYFSETSEDCVALNV
jgi:hypothetical protein